MSLHSNLVIFKSDHLVAICSSLQLYIPIWLYSNLSIFLVHPTSYNPLHSNLVIFKWRPKHWHLNNITIFTFQSGYIQMFGVGCQFCPFGVFTFQSGYIQMVHSLLCCKRTPSLHSNLVIFKSVHIIPPIYAAWKALFCRPINKCFL